MQTVSVCFRNTLLPFLASVQNLPTISIHVNFSSFGIQCAHLFAVLVTYNCTASSALRLNSYCVDLRNHCDFK